MSMRRSRTGIAISRASPAVGRRPGGGRRRAGGEALDRAIDRLSREDGGIPSAGGPSAGAGDAVPEGPSTGRLRLRALLLAAAGRWDEVADALDKALRRDPTDPWSQEVAS